MNHFSKKGEGHTSGEATAAALLFHMFTCLILAHQEESFLYVDELLFLLGAFLVQQPEPFLPPDSSQEDKTEASFRHVMER